MFTRHSISATARWLIAAALTLTPLSTAHATPGSVGDIIAKDTTHSFQDVAFGSPSVGLAGGDAGYLARTTDGGATWTSVATDNSAQITHVQFSSPTTAYATTAAGRVMRSTDSGATWVSGASLDATSVTALSFFGENSGFVGTAGGHLYATLNGTAWHQITSPTGNGAITAIDFSDATNGMLISGTRVYGTSDGAATWGATSNLGETLTDISYSGSVAYIVTATPSIYKSIDNGHTWNKLVVGTTFADSTLHQVDQLSSGAVVVTGSRGVAVFSTDGGATWFKYDTSGKDIFYTGAAEPNDSTTSVFLSSTSGLSVFDAVAPSTVSNLKGNFNGSFTSNTMPVFTWGAATDNANIPSYFAKIDGGATISLNKALTYAVQAPFAEGQHTFSVQAFDPAGNIGSPSVLTFTIDTTLPVVGSIMPSSGTVGTSVTIHVHATDTNGVASCTLFVNGVSVGPMAFNAALNDYALDRTFGGVQTYTLRAGCMDVAGDIIYTQDTIFSSNAAPAGQPAPQPPAPPAPPAPTPAPFVPGSAIGPGSLAKLPCPANASISDACRAVYFIGADGKRHAFPNSKIYFTWYADFSEVRTISADQMASYGLGKNIAYRPGVRMVKFVTGKFVYAVGKGGTLRWISSEAVAKSIYGALWAKQVDDISDAFFSDYTFGADIVGIGQYNAAVEQSAIVSPLNN